MIVINARFLTQSMTGVQRFAVEICLLLKKALGNDVKFVSPANILQKDYAELLEVEIVGTHQGHVWEQWDLPRYLKNNGSPLLLCLCNTAPLRYNNKVVTVHDVAFEAYPQTFSKSFLYVYRFMIPRIMKSAKHVITVSEFSKDEIVKYYGIDRDKISVVYNAVGDSFRPVPDEELSKKKYFLAVSSLNYRKNFLSVLSAFEIFHKENKDTQLYVIGDIRNANFKGVNIDRFYDNPSIKFLGRVSDEELVKYYSNAAAFVYPSIYEGFGIPPLEAQTSGCPVVVSDIPPLHEVVQESGLYCNPYDVNDIASAMNDILAKAENFRQKGYENVKRFSWDVSAKKIAQLIGKI